MRRIVLIVLTGFWCWAAPIPAQAETSALYETAKLLFDQAWSEASASVVAIAMVDRPDRHSIAGLAALQQRLETATVRVIELRPPPELLGFHLTALPALQEVTAAIRAVVEARRAESDSEVSAASEWLLQALVDFSATLKTAALER